MTTTVRNLKIQIAGETKARIAAEERAAAAAAQTQAAEKRERDLATELKRLRSEVSELQAAVKSSGVRTR